ncbi:MAG: hypothetical protein ACXVC6_01590 [Bacteroidia bacterium]
MDHLIKDTILPDQITCDKSQVVSERYKEVNDSINYISNLGMIGIILTQKRGR